MRKRPLAAVVGPVFSARTWLAMVYLVSGVPVSIAGFTLAVTGVALGIGLMPLALLGAPVLLLNLALCGRLAALERGRAGLLLDVTISPPAYRTTASSGRWDRARTALGDRARWRQVLGAVVNLPVSVAGFAVASSVWGIGLALVALPAYNADLPLGRASAFGWDVRGTGLLTAAVVAGALLLLVAPVVTYACAQANAGLSRATFGRRPALAARVSELELSRSRMVAAAGTDRRRLERDLHDGAQARLVSLAMELGRARAHLDDDPEQARVLVEQAHEQAKTALAELRNLVRGLHPPVLADRGLDAALSGLAALCPVPVTVRVEMAARPSQTVEAVAYFIVAEALTNVAKHSGATQAGVLVSSDGKAVHLAVTDNGQGGADPAGAGLAGLADRAQAVDGHLSVRSPAGGPTEIEAVLPCAS